ncbi:hypothetical protein ABPG77_009371 [Micractinium sp. CCAP 211/92]
MPTRPRRKPQRFGTFASEQELDRQSSEDEAPPPRRRRRQASDYEEDEESGSLPRRKAARKAAAHLDDEEDESQLAAGEGGSSSSESEDGSEEEEPVVRRRLRAGCAKRARTASKADPAAAAKPYVPAPPTESRSRADMLSLLFACPALIALGARAHEMAPLWHQLALRCNPGFSAGSTTEEAVEVARRAVRADPARKERLNKGAAQREYRLTEKDLAGLEFMTRSNPISHRAPPVKMYNKLQVLAVAHRRYGSMAGLEAAAEVAAAKSAKATETRLRNLQQRRHEMAAALEEAGMDGLDSHRIYYNKAITAFIKHGKGTAEGAISDMKAEEENARLRVQREGELRAKLHDAKLHGQLLSTAARAYIDGNGKQSLEAVVAGLKRDQEEAAAQAARKEQICKLLEAEGLSHSWEHWHGPKLPGVEEFVRTGEGTAEAVIKAAKEQRAAEQARRQRSQEVDALLAAEGMQHLRWRVPGLQLWVETGEGAGGEALVAAARRAEEEQGQRRQAMKELLSAEGLEWHMHSKGVDAWVSRGEGSEAEALAAARQANQTREQSHQRYRRLQDLLAAEGIEYWLVFEEPDVRAWWRCEGGSEEAALAAARAAWEPHRQRKHRRERLMAALKAEGIKYNEVCFLVPGLEAWLHSGRGDEAALLAAARCGHQEEINYRERRAALAPLLAAEGMNILEWQRRCYELGKYLAYGEGSAEEAVAAAKRSRDMSASMEAAAAATAAGRALFDNSGGL